MIIENLKFGELPSVAYLEIDFSYMFYFLAWIVLVVALYIYFSRNPARDQFMRQYYDCESRGDIQGREICEGYLKRCFGCCIRRHRYDEWGLVVN